VASDSPAPVKRGRPAASREWIPSVVYFLAAAVVAMRALKIAAKRSAWSIFAVGMGLYGLGTTLWWSWIGQLHHVPVPSVSDGRWLASYLCSYAAIVGMTSFRASRRPPPSRGAARAASWSVLFVPTGFASAALGLLIYSRVHQLEAVAFSLATLTLAAAVGRMALAFRDANALLEARRLAATDDLTSLSNRRQFMSRTEAVIEQTRHTGDALTVMMLDLDNFKQLNDGRRPARQHLSGRRGGGAGPPRPARRRARA
jgi:hypothetical protein